MVNVCVAVNEISYVLTMYGLGPVSFPPFSHSPSCHYFIAVDPPVFHRPHKAAPVGADADLGGGKPGARKLSGHL